MTARTAGWATALALGAGAALGTLARLLGDGAAPEQRASVAAVVVLGIAVAVGCAGLRFAVLSALAAAAAILVAGGGAASLGAALVVAGVAALSAGVTALARRLGASPASAVLVGAALPSLLAAGVFVADPVIEWDGSTPRSPRLSAWIYGASPLAAATSPRGGTGVDWQTCRLMYDGHGAGGLSVIGQYYPTRPPSAPLWGAIALAAGAVLTLGAGRSRGAPAADER